MPIPLHLTILSPTLGILPIERSCAGPVPKTPVDVSFGNGVKGSHMSLSRPVPECDSYARYSVLEYLLLGDLRDLLEEPPDTETRRWLLAVLEELLNLLPNEFEFEDQGGYLSEVREQFPN